jgi:hypothetical protein
MANRIAELQDGAVALRKFYPEEIPRLPESDLILLSDDEADAADSTALARQAVELSGCAVLLSDDLVLTRRVFLAKKPALTVLDLGHGADNPLGGVHWLEKLPPDLDHHGLVVPFTQFVVTTATRQRLNRFSFVAPVLGKEVGVNAALEVMLAMSELDGKASVELMLVGVSIEEEQIRLIIPEWLGNRSLLMSFHDPRIRVPVADLFEKLALDSEQPKGLILNGRVDLEAERVEQLRPVITSVVGTLPSLIDALDWNTGNVG